MTAGDIAQIITALAALGSMIVSGFSFAASIRNGRKLEVVHQATNGLTTQLVDLTAKSSLAEGVKQGREEVTHEQHSG